MICYKLISKKINENRKLVLAMNFFVTKYKKNKKFWFWRQNISMPNMEEIKNFGDKNFVAKYSQKFLKWFWR